MRYKTLMIAVLSMGAVLLTPSGAGAQTWTVDIEVDGSQKTTTVTCSAGQVLEVEITTNGVVQTTIVDCDKTLQQQDSFQWALSLTGGGYDISGGPSGYHSGGKFIGWLHMGKDWWLQGSFGPSWSRFDGEDGVMLSEFFGFQYRFADWFAMSLGARHRVHLGDQMHSVSPELQLQVKLTSWLMLTLAGEAGWARFVVEEKVSAASSVAPAEYRLTTDDSLIGGGSVDLRILF